MKIIHLIDSIKPGGAENVMVNYIKVSSELGFESTVVGAPSSESFETEMRKIADIQRYLTRNLIKTCDVVVIHSNRNLLRLFRYIPLLRKKKIKVCYIQHLFYPETKFRILAKFINQICTDFIQITPIIKDLVRRYIKIPVSEINNFYLNHYDPTQWVDIRAAVREELSIPEDKIVVAFSAIFKPGKGLKDVVEIAKSMSSFDRYLFLIIGDGKEAYYVQEYPFDNLKWIGRVNDVERFLIASDIYLFTSKFEMMPMALIEAINLNKKCIGYDTAINNHLLNGHTFRTIDRETVMSQDLTDGATLFHYDRDYGLAELKKLFNR